MRLCSFDGCDRKHKAKGLCGSHYTQYRLGHDLAPLREYQARGSSVRQPAGTGTINSHGYRQISYPTHPNAHKNGTVPEHRLVMEDHLGRYLFRDETVHHRNGDRTDNRIENLELWSGRHPKGSRVDDLVSYSTEILSRYAPELLNPAKP